MNYFIVCRHLKWPVGSQDVIVSYHCDEQGRSLGGSTWMDTVSESLDDIMESYRDKPYRIMIRMAEQYGGDMDITNEDEWAIAKLRYS